MPDLKYSPVTLIGDVGNYLSGQVGTVAIDERRYDQALKAAALLLDAFGIEPEFDPDDHSRVTEELRGFLLERQTKTTTRPRRAL